jgi:Domain of unknown function (DUF4328)
VSQAVRSLVLPPGGSHPSAATRRWTLVVAALLALHVLLAWLALQAVFVVVEITWRVVAGREELRPLLATHIDQFRTLRWLQGALWVVTAAVFVRWVGRALQSLQPLVATGLPYAPRQAVMAFLVPGPNLVRPIGVVGGIWNASNPRRPAGAVGRQAGAPARVVWWWALLVAAVAAEAVARILAVWSGDPLDFGPAMAVLAVGQVLTIAAAVVAIAIVLGVDTRQAARARDTGAG